MSRSNHGIKGPTANYLVGQRPHGKGKNLAIEGLVHPHASGYLRRQRRGRPSVHHILFLPPIRSPTGTRFQGATLLWVNGQFVRPSHPFPPTSPAVPNREGHSEKALPGNAPIPSQSLHPLTVPDAHMGRAPVELPPHLQQFLLEVEHSHKPLGCHPIFHRHIAALMHPHSLSHVSQVQ